MRLERVPGIVSRSGDPLQEEIQERSERLALLTFGERGAARAGVAVDDRELDLLLVGAEVEEQVEHLVHDLADPRIRPVDLVHDHDHRQTRLERLAQHEAGLRQRPLARVDQEEHAVDHRQTPLHLPAEVRMAGGVDDVDLDPAMAHRGVLREDRDALLALEVHRVHDALRDLLIRAEGARLPEHRVDQRGLTVVDVRHDRDVAYVFAGPEPAYGCRHIAPHPGDMEIGSLRGPVRGAAVSSLPCRSH